MDYPVALVIAACSLMLSSVCVRAETDGIEQVPGEPRTYIEELTVLGERDKETLSDESHSVATFDRDALDLATQQTFGELFERVPNVTTNRDDEPVIRGISQFGIDNGPRGSATTTSFFRDGLGLIGRPVLWDAIAVEVSRGPQNELRPSVGGLLAVGTSDPTDVFTGRGRLAWAPEGNDQVLGLAVGGPLIDDWSGRVSLYSRTDDGHTNNVTRNDDEWGLFEERLARMKLLWQPAASPGTTVRFLAEVFERERGSTEVRGSALNPSFDPFDRRASVDGSSGRTERTPAVVLDITHDFGNRWLSNLVLGGTRLKSEDSVDTDGTALPVTTSQTRSNFAAQGLVFITYYRGDAWLIRFRQRVSRFDSDFEQDNIGPFDFDGPGPIPGIRINTQVTVPWPEFYSWTTQLSLARSFGDLRFAGSLTWEGDTTGDDFSISTFALTRTGLPELDAAYDGALSQFAPQVIGQQDTASKDLLPMLSLSWSMTTNTILGVKWERARRAGGITVNIARKTVDAYHPENADNLDLFLRATRLDGRLSIAANAFYTRTKDLQTNAVLSAVPSDSQIVNADRATTAGIELELDWLTDSWNVFVRTGLLNTKLDDITVGLTDLSGNRYPFAPKWNVVVGASYHSGDLFGAVDFSTQAAAKGTIDNRAGAESQARQLLNGRIGWRWSRIAVSLYGRNLLDDEYFQYRDQNLPTGIDQTFQPGDPREVGVSFDFDW